MKQVFINPKGEIIVDDMPVPLCKDEGVLVKVGYSLISSGTELMSVKDGSLVSKVVHQPQLLLKAFKKISSDGMQATVDIVKEKTERLSPTGYSAAGIVVEVGSNVLDLKVGDLAACSGAGYANHSEYIYVPRNLVVKVPQSVSLKEAAFTTIGSIAIQGVRRAEVQFGERIVVFGLGLIGQIVCQILKVAGCNVLGIDLLKEKVELAEKLGINKGVVFDDSLLLEEVEKFTKGIGADAVIICASTKDSGPVNQAMKMCRDKGRVVVIGAVGMDLEREDFYAKELDFLISRSYGPGRYDKNYEEKGIDYPIGYVRWTENRNMEEFISLIESEKINLKPLISKEYGVNEAPNAYFELSNNPNTLAVLFKYDLEKTENVVDHIFKIKEDVSKDASKKNINIGIIGAGSFAKQAHLPIIKNISGFNITAVSTASGENAKKTAKQYGAKYCTTDFHDLLKDKDIDAVLVTTRHNLHKPIIIEAAKAGKHIFVEKPMAMNYEECREIAKVIEGTGVLLTVGFNRRFSPFAQKLKSLLKDKKSTLMMTYRVNAGTIPLDNWVNDPIEGGGRILGEACHFFDFLSWLSDEEPVEIYANKISRTDWWVIENDNLICTVRFSGGSLASLVYTTIGNSDSGKERLEVYTEGTTAVINDFNELILSGFNENSFKQKIIDKGHKNQMEYFLKVLKGEAPLEVNVKDGVRATVCCLKALESVNKGAPVTVDWEEYLR
ncbi:MAG: bi-domain-containing oxidoreductase [Actinobacteria bacterium]|nr:bi-domain-containing oxidoreductase [Actinomycetota bacterium]